MLSGVGLYVAFLSLSSYKLLQFLHGILWAWKENLIVKLTPGFWYFKNSEQWTVTNPIKSKRIMNEVFIFVSNLCFRKHFKTSFAVHINLQRVTIFWASFLICISWQLCFDIGAAKYEEWAQVKAKAGKDVNFVPKGAIAGQPRLNKTYCFWPSHHPTN